MRYNCLIIFWHIILNLVYLFSGHESAIFMAKDTFHEILYHLYLSICTVLWPHPWLLTSIHIYLAIYKEPSIISGTGAANWSKTNFGHTGFEIVSSCLYAPFPALLPLFKMHPESCVLCVQHRLRFCLDNLSCIKMAALQFYLKSGKQRRVGWVGEDSLVIFGQEFPGEMEVWDRALSWCNIKFLFSQSSGRSLRTFSHSRHKTSQQYAELTVWPARTISLWTIPMSKKSDEHSLSFAFHLSYLSWSHWVYTFCVCLMLFSPNTCLIIARVCYTFSEDLHKIWFCSFVGSIAKLHQVKYTTVNKRM
jgi:hypothetical protein